MSHSQSGLRKKIRITKRFNLISLGRHGLCLRKARAGHTPAFHFPVESLRPRLQVNRALCGLEINKKMDLMQFKVAALNSGPQVV